MRETASVARLTCLLWMVPYAALSCVSVGLPVAVHIPLYVGRCCSVAAHRRCRCQNVNYRLFSLMLPPGIMTS